MVSKFNQHERETLMSESYSLPTEPEGMAAMLVERFNSGEVGEMIPLYEPEAVLIKNDGQPVTGHAEIAAELERDLRLRPAAGGQGAPCVRRRRYRRDRAGLVN